MGGRGRSALARVRLSFFLGQMGVGSLRAVPPGRQDGEEVMSVRRFVPFVSVAVALAFGLPAASATSTNVRLTNDSPALSGYVSDYTLATGSPYTDSILSGCSQSRGRQNEPAVAVDPRNPDVIVGSSNDYCGVFNEDGTFNGFGPVWLGYYRSENGGPDFVSSLVPGYPGDVPRLAARADIRTADSGDPVLAWDNHGRLFAGSESSDDPAGTLEDVRRRLGRDVREPERRERPHRLMTARSSSAPSTWPKGSAAPIARRVPR